MVYQPTDFLTGIRSQKMRETSSILDAKKSKIDPLLFQDKCKKTILNPATMEYQLNDSLFSSLNGTSLMR